MRSILTLSGTQYSSLFVVISSFIPQKFKRFLFSTLRRVCVFRIGFLNMCSLYNLCRSAAFTRALDLFATLRVSLMDSLRVLVAF